MPSAPNSADAFDAVSHIYDKMRPGYVPQLYSDLFAYQPIGPDCRALEIGIGSGQATLPVLQTGCRLTAVEYGAQLAELCRRKFLKFENFSIQVKKFEDFAAPADSYDLIYAATAFHWIPETLGYPKVYELLKAGGTFARFANHPHLDASQADLGQKIQQLYDRWLPGPAPEEYSKEKAAQLAETARSYGFTDICYYLYRRRRTFSAEEYVALLDTYSDHRALPEAARNAFFDQIKQAILSAGGQITLCDTIDLELARKPY